MRAIVLVLQLCTGVTTLHSFYMRMHSFSANQKRGIFFMYIISSMRRHYAINHKSILYHKVRMNLSYDWIGIQNGDLI